MKAVYRALRQALGWALIGLGLVGLLVPVMPQLPFLIAGALLLAPYVRVFRRLSAWFHKKYPQHRGFMRRFREFKHRKSPPPAGPGTPQN